MENGVKNLKGAKLFPKAFSNHGFGDDSWCLGITNFQDNAFISLAVSSIIEI